MGNIFFWADPHFDHAKIMGYTGRPFANVDEMNETLVANYNKVVGHKDTVYILGDFAFKRHSFFLNRLNGKKIFIFGNHDHMPQDTLRQFTDVVGSRKRPGTLELSVEKQHVVLCHFPMASWNASFHGSWHLYGHCHGTFPEMDDRLSFDVGVDVWNFTPVSWESVKQKMEFKKHKWSDVMEGRKYSSFGELMRKSIAESNLKWE